jgi:hypothetical protein
MTCKTASSMAMQVASKTMLWSVEAVPRSAVVMRP